MINQEDLVKELEYRLTRTAYPARQKAAIRELIKILKIYENISKEHLYFNLQSAAQFDLAKVFNPNADKKTGKKSNQKD